MQKHRNLLPKGAAHDWVSGHWRTRVGLACCWGRLGLLEKLSCPAMMEPCGWPCKFHSMVLAAWTLDMNSAFLVLPLSSLVTLIL